MLPSRLECMFSMTLLLGEGLRRRRGIIQHLAKSLYCANHRCRKRNWIERHVPDVGCQNQDCYRSRVDECFDYSGHGGLPRMCGVRRDGPHGWAQCVSVYCLEATSSFPLPPPSYSPLHHPSSFPLPPSSFLLTLHAFSPSSLLFYHKLPFRPGLTQRRFRVRSRCSLQRRRRASSALESLAGPGRYRMP